MVTPRADSYAIALGADLIAGDAVAPTPPPPPAPTITLSSDGAAIAGTAEAITVTAANLTGPLVVTMESVSGPGVSWSPTTVAPAPGDLVKLSMATFAAAGSAQVRGTAPGGIVSNTLTVPVSPAPPPPPPPHPLAASLDLIAAAHAAGQMWVRLDNGTQTFQTSWPATEYRDPNANFAPIIYAWGGFAWDDTAGRIVLFGGGHANSAANQVFEWSGGTRGWRLSFHGSEHLDMDAGSTNTHRVKDYNGAPVSSHTYCNNVWLATLNKFFTFGGAAWNDGSVLRVWETGTSGFQPSLRIAGGFSLDMTLAGTGRVAGATGSNFGPSLTGANAWTLHDWMAPGHASPPVFSGTAFNVHINAGAVSTVESDRDVVYATAGSTLGLVRTEFVDSNPANDLNTLVCNGVDFNGDGEVLAGGNLAMDPVDRVVLALARGNGSFEPFRFVDLKRGTRSWRRPTSPTGQADLKAESKGEPGLLWDPVDGCFVAATRGSFASPGIFAFGSTWRIYKPAPVGGVTPDAGFAVTRRDPAVGSPVPPMNQWPGESFVQVCGRFRWANGLRCGLYLTDPTNGQVWAYIPENWTDPRL